MCTIGNILCVCHALTTIRNAKKEYTLAFIYPWGFGIFLSGNYSNCMSVCSSKMTGNESAIAGKRKNPMLIGDIKERNYFIDQTRSYFYRFFCVSPPHLYSIISHGHRITVPRNRLIVRLVRCRCVYEYVGTTCHVSARKKERCIELAMTRPKNRSVPYTLLRVRGEKGRM